MLMLSGGRREAIWVAIFLLAAAPSGGSEIPFAAAEGLHLGSFGGAIALRAGDFDGDGDLDVVGAGALAGEIRWFENTAGDGSAWTQGCVDDAFPGASGLAVHDMDQDGDADVVGVSFSSGDVAWWELGGDGSCGWNEHQVTTVGSAGTLSVAVADFDLDGDPDVATISDTELRLTGNLGGGSFTGAASSILGGPGGTSGGASVAVGDLDGDGDPDLLSTESTAGQVTWWENVPELATGPFAFFEHLISGGILGARDVAAADLDGDGDLDILAASDTTDPFSRIFWWENSSGDGSTWSSLQTIDGDFVGAWSVAAADLDRDGDLDVLAAADVDDELAWWEQIDSSTNSWLEHPVSGLLDGGRDALAADLDGDGDLDLVATSFDDDFVAWWENETIHQSALFGTQEVTVEPLYDGIFPVSVGDLDGDGDLDVAGVSIVLDELSWWRNTAGDGSSWSRAAIDSSFIGREIVLGDLDRDGDLDLVGAEGDLVDEITWWRNTAGDGSTWSPLTIGDTFDAGKLRLADVDRDGLLDVVAYDTLSHELVWWKNSFDPAALTSRATLNGGNQWVATQITPFFNQIEGLAVGDVDGDGDLDVLASSPVLGGDLVWWSNDDGSGATWTEATIEDNATNVDDIAVGDLDGDGDLDVVGIDDNTGLPDVLWWENALGQAAPWVRHELPGLLPGAQQIAVADLDHDGDLDLVGRGTNGGSLRWWENLAAAQSWRPADSIPVGGPQGLAIGDVDGDGSQDVLATAANDDRIFWLPNLGGQLALSTTDVAPATLVTGQTAAVLSILASHRGRPGDPDLELVTIELLFEESPGVVFPNTGAALALIDHLSLYLDDGDGLFDPASDTLVIDAIPDLDVGVMPIFLLDGDPAVQIQHGVDRLYLLTVTTTLDGDLQSPNTLRITHRTEFSSTAEDADHDLPATLEWAANVASSTVQIVPPPCYLLTLAHSGTGSDPVATPTTSVGCASGRYLEGELITLTAAPATGWQVSGWSGSDDDASTSTLNALTMPAGATAVTVTYTSLPCFPLTLAHSGMGADPLADPAFSAGCGADEYHAGEAVALTAAPDPNWVVSGWSGTDDDASAGTSNTVTMPVGPAAATVSYLQALFADGFESGDATRWSSASP